MTDNPKLPTRCMTFPNLGKIHCFRGAEWETRFIYREIFQDLEYESDLIVWRAGMSIVDVGANVGMFAIFAHRKCQGDCRILCFEPIPAIYELLRRNLTDHGCLEDGKVLTINRGLTQFDGPDTLNFTFYPKVPGNSTSCLDEKKKDFTTLDSWVSDPQGMSQTINKQQGLKGWLAWLAKPLLRRTLHSYLAKCADGIPVVCQLETLTDACLEHDMQVIDLLKIDVEGAELDVLKGVDDSLWQRIEQVAMEAHDVEGRPEEISALLREKGFARVHVERPDFAKDLPVNNVNIFATRAPVAVAASV